MDLPTEPPLTPAYADNSLPKEVEIVSLGDKTIILVGTAHVSRESVELAERVIRDTKPDSVAVELCPGRFASMKDPERWKKSDIFSIIRKGDAPVLIAQLILAGFQRKLGDAFASRPGEEMVRAAAVTEEIGAQLVLADREVKITLKRTGAALDVRTYFKIAYAMLSGLLAEKLPTAEDISELTKRKNVEELLEEFAEQFPTVRRALIDERDQYLASKIREAPGRKIVAVMGAGHLPGIVRWLSKDIDRDALESLPPPSLLRRAMPVVFPALIIGILCATFFSSGSEEGVQALHSWIFVTALSGMFGALLATAHPLSILVAGATSPFLSLNPMLRPGWLSGLTEAWVRKPTVGDFESVVRDITTVRGIWRNGLSRVLLVLVFTNLFSLFGAMYGAALIAKILVNAP